MKKSFFKQKDKQKHIGVSVLISVVVSSISCILHYDSWMTVAITLLFIVIVSFLKEVVYDFYLGRGTPDVMDVVANFIGFTLGFIIVQAYIYATCVFC